MIRRMLLGLAVVMGVVSAQEGGDTRNMLASSVKKTEKKKTFAQAFEDLKKQGKGNDPIVQKNEGEPSPEATKVSTPVPNQKNDVSTSTDSNVSLKDEIQKIVSPDQGGAKSSSVSSDEKAPSDDMDDAAKVLAAKFDDNEKNMAAVPIKEKVSIAQKNEGEPSPEATKVSKPMPNQKNDVSTSTDSNVSLKDEIQKIVSPDQAETKSSSVSSEKEVPAAVVEKDVASELVEQAKSRELFKGPKKPETPVESAEAGNIEDYSKDMISTPIDEIPQPPHAVDAKKEAEEKELVPLELTPPECLPTSLDTTDVDAGGNWVIKRAFWEQAEKTYEKIMRANNELYDQQVKYMKARTDIDKQTDSSFRELGFEQGQLQELLSSLIEDVKNQREEQGELDEKERAFLQTLKEKQRNLEQFQLNLAAIGELENSINQAMSNLMKQITSCRKYEKQAWEHFKAIGKELNDKKARLLFYEMEGFLKTVEKNHEYVTNELWKYFMSTADQIKEQLASLKKSIDALKEKGTDLNTEYESFVQKDKEHDEQEIAAEKEQVQKELAEIAKRKKELDQGFFGRVKTWFGKTYDVILSGIGSIWLSIKKMIGIKK